MGLHTGSRTASEIPGLDIAEHRSWQNYLTATLWLSSTLNRRLTEAHQLSIADLGLLQALSGTRDEGARMGDLAALLEELPCRLTRQTHRLEGHGLVRRCTSSQDRRGVVVAITTAGRQLAEQATMTYAQNVRASFLDYLSRTQVGAMRERCGRILMPFKQSQHGS
jgi:DNA-binding MarR family transcriptional regulator